MERLFELPQIKLQGGNATRWESNKEATDVMRRILPALIADLSLQARNEPTAQGLYSFVKDKFLPPALCLMQLVHEKIHQQFLVFQKRNLFFSQVEQEVTVLKSSLAQLKESNMVKDRWQAWLQSDAGLKPLQEEVPAYFQDDVWESFKNIVCIKNVFV
ncbi:uncharacterized protein LOC111859658 [Xyrichtys novacula]|uniref:Uncharacterized protein LOC111859658 n=1 Tax=Xyrichtys novacula TaxID=13765 RepID=A0AAV1HE00_XYRNO|nr:uncharacterized protein LOC111859658 [Xyrichtys novacula]